MAVRLFQSFLALVAVQSSGFNFQCLEFQTSTWGESVGCRACSSGDGKYGIRYGKYGIRFREYGVPNTEYGIESVGTCSLTIESVGTCSFTIESVGTCSFTFLAEPC